MFVELNEIYVEGLVHISELSNDYYHFDPVHHCLSGERSQKTYRLGDSVEVKVVRVDLDEKKIDLQMVGLKQSAKNFGKSKAKKTESKKAQSKKEKYTKKKIDSTKKPKPSKKLKHKKRQATAESKSGKGKVAGTKNPDSGKNTSTAKPKKKPSARRSKKPNAKPKA